MPQRAQPRRQPLRTVVQVRPRRDPKLYNFLRMVQNPWNGPVIGSPVADRNIPQTNIIRRSSVFVVNLADTQSDTSGGVEMAFVMNGLRDPYAAVATSLSSTPVVTYHGRGQGTAIPDESYARVIASGVKITFLGAAQDRGGVWSHFNYARESSNLLSLGIGPSWGNLAASMQYAVSSHPVTTAPLKFIDSPETGFAAIKLLTENALDGGLPSPDMNVAIMRLLYQGPKQAFNFRFEVSEVLEYFHTSHEMWSKPAVQHASGEAIVVSTNNVLSQRGSGVTANPDKPGWFEKVADIISKGAGVAGDVLGVLERGKELLRGAAPARASAAVPLIEEVAEDVALLAL